MLKLKKLIPSNYFECYNLISASKNDLTYFEGIGWKLNQFKAQFTKENNFSLGLFKSDFMQSFVIGDIITVEKIIEYEILLLYVNFKYRKLGYASKLLYEIPFILKNNNLKKIYLEVSMNNFQAIRLYKKNNFTQIGFRKNYYKFNNIKFDSILFEKKIYE